jgi:wyosine [tRNA(Phe)-imidazoG37] synthetase (radical SAM superfamily)
MSKTYKHLFGPVPSRRLGRSLGVDLTPFKTCTLDCIFCQLGRTTNKTIQRTEYVPGAEVEAELEAWIKEGGKADYITLSGSGEPTLHTRFGDILQFIRDRTAIPSALLSNGTLFPMPEVREAAKQADLVKLSLSAWNQVSFEHLNRPHPDLDFAQIMKGYWDFRNGFQGMLWIEVFLVPGVNTLRNDLEKIAELVEALNPDEVHLNTAVRPPAEEFALAMPQSEMESLSGLFRPVAKVIAEFSSDTSAEVMVNEDTILAMLQRRPCTAHQIARVFGMHLNEVSKYLGKLSRTGKICVQGSGSSTYYSAAKDGARGILLTT